MKKEIVNPYVGNFIKSLRDVGYTFEVAIADIIDNSIDAKAKNIKISITPEPKPRIVIYDDGTGMAEKELVEAMRLASKDPNVNRGKKALGKFGLGLKTASFSQCKKLTVITKQDKKTNIRQWDLEYIEKSNEWYLLTPKLAEYSKYPFMEEFTGNKSGTVVILEEIDRYEKNEYADLISSLCNHLELTFHRFLEGRGKIKIDVNGRKLESFDPFNLSNMATQCLDQEKIKIKGKTTIVEPFILPHHSKVSQQEFKKYGTEEGYTKTQGFYIYRANRLLIHGTWLGLHKISDAHKLVRVKLEIPNNQDEYWGIDIKKSTAKPIKAIKEELRRIIKNVTTKGSRPYTGRGKRISSKKIESFWDTIPVKDGIKFALKKEHPLYQELKQNINEKNQKILELYLNGVETFIPLNRIQAQLMENPHEVKQMAEKEELREKIKELESLGVSSEIIALLKESKMYD